MPLQLTMGKDDQAKYGGPEWVTLELGRLDEIDFDELDALERQILDLWKCSIPVLLASEFFEDTARGKRGGIWLARKLADIETPDLADFKVKTQQIRARAVKAEADVVPPSSSTSLETEPSATP